MRLLTLEAFKLMYVITGGKSFSYYFSLVVNTIMNVIVLKGTVLVAQGALPMIGYLEPAFRVRPPFIAATAVALFFINKLVVPTKMLEFVGQMKTKYIVLALYFLITCLLSAYLYGDGRYF